MSGDILNRILAQVQENRTETRRLSDKVERLTAVVDRVEDTTDRLVTKMEDVKVRLYAVESAVVGNVTTVASQSHRLDSLDLRMKLIEKRLELRDTP